MAFGEGYHNYHHEFPHDYSNGIRRYHHDPTKWISRCLPYFGFCSRLVRFPNDEIRRAEIQVRQTRIRLYEKQQ